MLIDLESACRAVCDRCAEGHPVGQDAWGDWEHGTEHVGGGVYAPPEPCAADALRKLAAEEGVTTAAAAVGALVTAMDEEEAKQC